MLTHYCIYTRDLHKGQLDDLRKLDIPLEIHANRTRFFLNPDHKLHSLFLLKYSEVVYRVDRVTLGSGTSCLELD